MDFILMELELKIGKEVIYNGKKYKIKAPLSLEKVLLTESGSFNSIDANISDLSVEKVDNNEPYTEISSISDADWEEAKRREKVIRPLANQHLCVLKEAKAAAKLLDLGWRQIYNLINHYRERDGKLIALLPGKSTGGKGRKRIHSNLEIIIQSAIDDIYLTKQQNKISKVVEEVFRRCHIAKIPTPSERTIRRRVEQLQCKEVMKKRKSKKESDYQYSPIIGGFPEPEYPLETFQIDHTPVDLIIVDEEYRQPIGRPYITIAIDVFSRCIPGFCLTLEPPSALSVGLCLTHSVYDKDNWLGQRGIESKWPIWGKPDCIYVDNAKEFHCEALQRGCEAHGITIKYRPVGQPHYGGIIERLIGTMMQLIHSVPGTTFSNLKEKGQYNSEKKAVLTLTELERWFTIAITNYYHQKVHSGIKVPPIERYYQGILGDDGKKGKDYPARIQGQEFLIDFLPIERRSLQRHGFMLDHIAYYNNSLSPFIGNRSKYGKFLIRRDPRDLSRIYVLDPISDRYIEVTYRSINRPTITLWEHRKAIKHLHSKGIKLKDENIIFKAVEQLRDITRLASLKTKSARRLNERINQANKSVETKLNEPASLISNQTEHDSNKSSPQPFEDIELW
jgi:putative transposase